MAAFPEFGFYALPGHADDPARAIDEARAGEDLGLGSIWLSERLGAKDAPVISGAVAATTKRLTIGSGLIANLPLRHPLAIASYGATMQLLSGGRFIMGLGRGIPALARGSGTPSLTLAKIGAYVNTLRALWRGDSVEHDAGHWQMHGMGLGLTLEAPPPIYLGVEGDKTARWAGAHCDGVIIQALWSPEGTEHTVGLIRAGAEEAGRDPSKVAILAALVTACETTEDELLQTVIRRWNTYLHYPRFLDNLCRVNGWDRSHMERVRQQIMALDETGSSSGPWGDENTSRELDHLRRSLELWPADWLRGAFATGDRQQCAGAVRERFDAGVDGVVFHGTTPGNLAPLLDAWPGHRPATLTTATMGQA